MALTIYVILAWYTVQLMVSLPKKLPLAANVLTYMVISMVDINKLSLLAYRYEIEKVNTEVPKFIAVILHRDFIFSLSLIIFANVFLTTSNRKVKWLMVLYTFVFSYAEFLLLLRLDIMETKIIFMYWNIIVIVVLMGLTVVVANALTMLMRKGEHRRG